MTAASDGIRAGYTGTYVRHCSARRGLGGEPKRRFHDLRHTYASMLIAQGLTPAQVSDQLGHKHAGITLARYTHLFQAQNSRERFVDPVGAGHQP